MSSVSHSCARAAERIRVTSNVADVWVRVGHCVTVCGGQRMCVSS